MDDEASPQWARPAQTSPFGKCTEQLKVWVDEETRDALAALAYLQGMSVSEYLRHQIFAHVYGYRTLMRLHQQRLGARAGMGPGLEDDGGR